MVQQQITTSWLLESVGHLNFRLDIQITSLNIDQTIPFFGLSVSKIELLLLVLKPKSGSELRGSYSSV